MFALAAHARRPSRVHLPPFQGEHEVRPCHNAPRPASTPQLRFTCGVGGVGLAAVAACGRDGAGALPADLEFDAIGGLANEAREKLHAARPATLGAAGRISGVTPAALTALLGHVQRRAKNKQATGNKRKNKAA